MKYPVENFREEWNTTAGYGFADPTPYGFHEGIDINDNGGGNSDLGKPVYAVAEGVISSVHNHTTGFGNHIHLKVETEEGTRYFHYAHLDKVFCALNQIVKEGQLLGTVGNTGTVYAHLHFACKKRPTGIDAIAHTIEELNDGWENPIEIIDRLNKPQTEEGGTTVINDQTKIDLGVSLGILEVQQIRSRLLDLIRDLSAEKSANLRLTQTINEMTDKLLECGKTESESKSILVKLRDAILGVLNFK